MPFQLIFPDSYLKRARKFIRKHPELIKQYEKTLLLLELNPHHPSLRLHQLQGQLSGLSSISINMSYRLVIDFKITGTEIILLNVGSHDQVY